MRLILNTIALICGLSASELMADCVTDKRPAKMSTEAAMSITLHPAQIKLGESAKLQITLTNTSNRSLTVTETSAEREFQIRILDPRGAEPSLTEEGKRLRGKGKFPTIIYRNFRLTLAPREDLKGEVDISKIYLLTFPGDYRATVCRSVVELGPLLSNTVILTVLP